MRNKKIRYSLLILIAIGTAVLCATAIGRLRIDTNVVSGLPGKSGVLADAVYIFKHHPLQNEIAIDIGLDRPDKDALVRAAGQIEEHLRLSGLFTKVGVEDLQQVVPQLIDHVVDELPFLFSETELRDQISPLISPEAVALRFKSMQESLMSFDSIGQSGLMRRDPLGFRELKLAGLSSLAPSGNAQIYQGQLLSADARHVMVLAQPAGSGTDTAFARRLTAVMSQIGSRLDKLSSELRVHFTLTPVGAYRAALDNETMIRRDVNKAIILATLGIAVLLLIAFPRPLMGLLALLPALVGTTMSLFVFSLLYKSISIMALGFGGAVISITVDHGIAYLLFLDRPEETSGKYASREVWAVGLLAVLTTIGAFVVLSFSGFQIFKELGIFTAMGIAFSFLFVHLAFPRIFPNMPPARISRPLPLQRWADWMFNLGWKGCLAALLTGACLAFWAKPHFNADLSTMNSVSEATRSAESHFTSVWGDIFSKTYLMSEAPTLQALQEKGDRLLGKIEIAQKSQEIRPAFVPSQLFPGPERIQSNFAAWKSYWTQERVRRLRVTLSQSASRFGFNEKAFEPFLKILAAPPAPSPASIDRRFYALLGISRSAEDGPWRQITGITAGPRYDGDRFYANFSGIAKVFDAHLFADKMGRLLTVTFTRMLLIIGLSVVVLLLLFFADWQLTFISLLPMAFAFVCTVGSLRLMGRDLDIPALMLAIVVLGMGIDYSLFFVRAYQRYQENSHPNFGLIRLSVFMASVSTLIGFGSLCSAKHTLLQSAGISSSLGIGFSVIGAFLILPPILERRFNRRAQKNPGVQARYRNLEPYPRFFARFKLKLDPMFDEMPAILPPLGHSVHTILDIGTGYGVPACWLLQRYPEAKIYGIEPEPDRVRVANLAIGSDGRVERGLAPTVPQAPCAADAAFMLDMCHFLDDDALRLTFMRLHEKLKAGGFFIMRIVLEPRRAMPWTWWLENSKMKLNGARSYYRTLEQVEGIMRETSFDVQETKSSGNQNELAWVIAKRQV